MDKVNNNLDALVLCQKHRMTISFKTDINFNRNYVVVSFGFKEVAGDTLVQAVNRIVDLYCNAPVNYEKLSWYEESQKYLFGIE